jgi:hypothetical protein
LNIFKRTKSRLFEMTKINFWNKGCFYLYLDNKWYF